MSDPGLEEMTGEMRRRVGKDSGFGHTIFFDFGDEGCLFIDAKTVPHQVTNQPGDADIVIKIKYADFCKISDGRRSPTAAFMAGRMKVSGNVAAAWKLGSILDPSR